MTNRQLFLDCDGVLANFDDYAKAILKVHPRTYEAEHGEDKFWAELEAHGGFYRKLPVLAEGRKLFEAVKHLNPVILTGCPEGGWAEPQKVEWAEEHFPGTKIITCRSADKRKHMKPGDVLVDDYLKYRDRWIEAGGEFVHFQGNAAQTITELRALGFEIAMPEDASRTGPVLFNRAGQREPELAV